ncbi:MBOAT, membrane-bound O-acyltransferase family-domain-containing protein [Chytriomyces sp. MP71]|nr:MBOAT, membrane-bound O-acyltransferase family-domain-containing protein [Chytriomyces sp. MP71]
MGILDLSPLQEATGLSVDVLGPGLALFSAYLLALPFSLVRSAAGKHLFSVAASGLLFTALFNVQGFVQLLALAALTYGLSLTNPKSSNTPVVVLTISLLVLALNHLNAQFFKDELSPRFDQTVPMMIAVQKMATFAWSVYDGTKEDRVGVTPASFSLKSPQFAHQALSPTQKSQKITQNVLPTFIEYLGFIFFYPSFILGPSFHFNVYKDFVLQRGSYKIDKGVSMLPGRWAYFYQKVGIGAVCTVIHLCCSPIWSYDFALTDEFITWSFLSRCAYMVVASLIQQCQFFSAWKLAEGACVLCGFGYEGPDPKTPGKYKWNRCENVRIAELELAENPRMFMSAWNVQTALWLRSAIYLRLAPEPLPDQTLDEIREAKKHANIATHVTFLVSAFWHGFYPGFYLTFMTLSFLTTSNRLTRKLFRTRFHVKEGALHALLPLYHFVGWFATLVSVNYCTVGMQMKRFSAAMTIWGRIGFYVHIAMAVLYAADVLVELFAKKKGARKTKGGEDVNLVSKKIN